MSIYDKRAWTLDVTHELKEEFFLKFRDLHGINFNINGENEDERGNYI